MGRVAAPYGVRGWMKVQPHTEATEALLGYPIWWLPAQGRGEPVPHRLVEGREHSGLVVAQLDGVMTREEAAAYRGAQISVPRDALPATDEDQVYWSDLVGCIVVNRHGVTLGTVADLQDNGAQPILRVAAAEGGERLIPWVPAIVQGVDLEANRVDVDWDADY